MTTPQPTYLVKKIPKNITDIFQRCLEAPCWCVICSGREDHPDWFLTHTQEFMQEIWKMVISHEEYFQRGLLMILGRRKGKNKNTSYNWIFSLFLLCRSDQAVVSNRPVLNGESRCVVLWESEMITIKKRNELQIVLKLHHLSFISIQIRSLASQEQEM